MCIAYCTWTTENKSRRMHVHLNSWIGSIQGQIYQKKKNLYTENTDPGQNPDQSGRDKGMY